MKIIFRVAKTELRTLFYSPIAWFLIIIFFIQSASSYLSVLKSVARVQDFGGLQAGFLELITTKVFIGLSGVYRGMMSDLYLYLPLITMSLISREMGSGTIKLLYSSPIKIRDIVLGKFLSMMMFNLVLLSVIAVFSFSGVFHIQHAETGMIMTGLFGFYLLLCAYSAIGLFMSTLSTYQVVVALCTFVMFGVLTFIGTVWQRVEFVRDLTYFLSMAGRTNKMMQGLLTTKDIIYFFLIVFLFLSFAISKLKGSTQSKPWTVKALQYAKATVIVLVIGYVTSIPSLIGYYDATWNKINTITPVVQKVVEEMAEAPLEITSFANLADETYMIDGPDDFNKTKARWEPYLRYNANMKFDKISYWDSALNNPNLFLQYPGKTLKEISDMHAKRFDMDLEEYLNPEEIRKIVDLRPELNRYVMRVKWKDEEAWLRTFEDDDGWPSGTEIAVVLKRLQKQKMPKLAFITGELERDLDKLTSREYRNLANAIPVRNSLVNQGFDVVKVDLQIQDIPADIDAVVLADPKFELQAGTKNKLLKYINEGGNVLITTEPGKQALMDPILKEIGVQLMPGLIVQEGKYSLPHETNHLITPFGAGFYKILEKIRMGNGSVTMPGVTGISWNDTAGFEIKPLLHSIPGLAWYRVKPYDPETMTSAKVYLSKTDTAGLVGADSAANKKLLGIINYSPADGDKLDSIPTVISLTRKVNNKQQRIIVSADADFLSNTVVGNSPVNLFFSTGVFSWLTGGKFPVDSTRPDPVDNGVTITVKQLEKMYIIYIYIIPALLLALGAVILIRRKRK